MPPSKYATVSEDEDGALHLTLGKQKTEYSLAQIKDEGGDIVMDRLHLERRALLHLPERMDSERFNEFVDGRKIADVILDCVGIENGGEE